MKNRNLDHKDNWMTPPNFLKTRRFDEMFDPCPFMHDLNKWDGLKVSWKECNFVNPPYSSKLKELFVKKAISESKLGHTSTILIPSSTSTVLFHDVIVPEKPEIEFLRGRLNFIGYNSKGQHVNWEQIKYVDKNEKIEYDGELIPKYIKQAGQQDLMLVTFREKKQPKFYII